MQVFPFHAFSQDITNLQVWLIVTSVRFGKKLPLRRTVNLKDMNIGTVLRIHS